VKQVSPLTILPIAIIIFLAIETCREGISYNGASPQNIRWDGVSNFVEQLRNIELTDVIIVDNWVRQRELPMNNYSCGIIFFISPEKSFTQAEVNSISSLVLDKGFNLVILDEGPYTNLLLKSLNLSISIEAYRYVESMKIIPTSSRISQSKQFPVVTPGFIELKGRIYYIFFSYASPVTINNNSMCIKVAYTVEGISLGALCRTHRGSVLVIGDGSIALNAVVPSPPGENMYTEVLKRIVNTMCSGHGKKIILVDGSKYNLRVLTFSELIEEGYSFLEALALTVNPFRYIYVALENLNISILLSVLGLTIVIVFIASVRYFLAGRGKGSESSREVYVIIPGYGRIVVDFVEKLCKSDSQCVKNVPCITRRFVDKKCVEKLSDYMSKDREFRKKVVETLLLYKR
jgi:hypothetical protein